MSIRGSSIDLGAIIGSALGDSTATRNPMFNASYNDESQQWEDSDGNALDDKYQKHLNDISDSGGDPYASTRNPYNTPTYTTKIFHPEVAQQEANYNNAWNLQGPQAQHTQDIANSVNTKQATLAAPIGTSLSKMTPLQQSIATGGRFDTQAQLGAESAAAKLRYGIPLSQAEGEALGNTFNIDRLNSDLSNNLPAMQSEAATTGAKATTAQNENSIAQSKAASPFIPQDTKTLYGARIAENTNAEMGANANRQNIEPQANLTHAGIVGGLTRLPLTQATQDAEAANQLEATRLRGQQIAAETSNEPSVEETQKNLIEQNRLKSGYMTPSPTPLAYKEGKLVQDPYYVNMMNTLNAKLNGGSGLAPNIPQGNIGIGGGLSIKPLTKGQSSNTSLQDTPPVNKEVFDEVASGWSPHQKDVGHDALITSIGKNMKVEPSEIGSSVFTHSLNSTVEEKLKDPEFVKALNNLTPEQLDDIYRSALKAGSKASVD